MLWFAAASKPLGHIVVRAIGALILTAGVCGIQGDGLPRPPARSGRSPGGSSAPTRWAQLTERFNAFSIVWLLLAIAVGAVVALDVWAILAAMWAGKALGGAVMTAGRQGGKIATQLAQMRVKDRADAPP